ncbi:TetR family transcriptional regulator [Rhodococcus sp. TAF43]|uniref:TetR family transcriptional regulator n=1 Tax=unclassified Rhodococcus (in: high G+C Gram-positive bacteria) TaxID=192944 RepID=UPI000E2CA61B|nr:MULTISPECIES: TetR family transcriptional regulator [unclassified Rhodococcus (in: high G+C Gram-positive bacteria)]RDI26869.1 TetR family transcriptional regulator [Rhodococcus sp. AG1013]
MSTSTEQLGLRERKKLRTRAQIREHAMRLFTEQGYAATTVEQIAAAAEVSPSTFFRYFPSKEQLILIDDLDAPILEAVAAQPPEVPPLTACRQAFEQVLSALSAEEREAERTRQRLLFGVPELRAAMIGELTRSIGVLADAIGSRVGRPADEFEVRVLAGVIAGAVLGAVGGDAADPPDLAVFVRAIEFLEQGMPLS